MQATDWMALAFERFQSAVRTVRLTLPPGRHAEFWSRLLELAQLKRRGLVITVLIDDDLINEDAIRIALQTIPELDQCGHEISWVIAETLPYRLFIVDDAWALVVCGDPDDPNDGAFARLTDNADEATRLREAFDRRAGSGQWDVAPGSWLEWLDKAPHRPPTKSALAALHRHSYRLHRAVVRSLKQMPKRSCWLLKPRDSAYGIPEPPGGHQWLEWREHNLMALGWPLLVEPLGLPKMPSRRAFVSKFSSIYHHQQNTIRAYATIRHFVEDMRVGDRAVAVEGWTAHQNTPVRFHGWTHIEGAPEINRQASEWPLVRRADWRRYELDLPIEAVRAATGLESATYPLHKLETGAFRRLVALAEEVRRNKGDSQLLLDLALMNHTPAPFKE